MHAGKLILETDANGNLFLELAVSEQEREAPLERAARRIAGHREAFK